MSPSSDEGPRSRVLAAVRAAPAPVSVTWLAEGLGMAANTLRYHLAALERSGELERAASVAAGRGRPPLLYRAASTPATRRYDLLADALLAGLGEGAAAFRRAEAAGEAWGRAYAASAGPAADPVEGLVGFLVEAGFAPRRDGADAVDLANCPFREAVGRHGELPCAVHAGMMRAVLAVWDAPLTVSRLDPLVEPGLCRARLGDARAAA